MSIHGMISNVRRGTALIRYPWGIFCKSVCLVVYLFVCLKASDLVGCRQVHIAHGIAFGSIPQSQICFVLFFGSEICRTHNLYILYIYIKYRQVLNICPSKNNVSRRCSLRLKPIHWPTQPLAMPICYPGLFYPIYAACVELDVPLCLQALLVKTW